MRKVNWCMAVAAGVALTMASVRAAEEKVPLDQLPKAVAAAVQKRFPDAKLVSAAKEKDGDKTVFEVTIKNEGHNVDVSVTPEGAITDIEKQIGEKDVPKAVADALSEKYPRATLKLREEVIKVTDGKEKLEYYEFILVTQGKKELEVCVSPEGKIVKVEDKSKAKD